MKQKHQNYDLREMENNMNSFYLACSAVVPLLVYMVIGILIRSCGLFSRENFRALNRINFRVLIALSLFFSIYNSELGESIRPGLFAFLFFGLIISGITAWFAVGPFTKNIRDRATVTQGIFRSNYVLYGSVVAGALCGAVGQALAGAASMIVVTTINAMSVILFELCRGEKIRPGKLVVRVFSNPLVVAAVLAILFGITGIRLPELLYKPLYSLGQAATPIAMVTLGGILSFGKIKDDLREISAAVLGKLVIVPFIWILLGILLSFRQEELVVILVAFGCPTAVASAPMAQEMGGNGDLAGEIVAATSVLSLITMFLFILVLSQAGLIG